MWCRLEAMPIPITPYAFYANAQSSPVGFCPVLQFVVSYCMKMMDCFYISLTFWSRTSFMKSRLAFSYIGEKAFTPVLLPFARLEVECIHAQSKF